MQYDLINAPAICLSFSIDALEDKFIFACMIITHATQNVPIVSERDVYKKNPFANFQSLQDASPAMSKSIFHHCKELKHFQCFANFYSFIRFASLTF